MSEPTRLSHFVAGLSSKLLNGCEISYLQCSMWYRWWNHHILFGFLPGTRERPPTEGLTSNKSECLSATTFKNTHPRVLCTPIISAPCPLQTDAKRTRILHEPSANQAIHLTWDEAWTSPLRRKVEQHQIRPMSFGWRALQAWPGGSLVAGLFQARNSTKLFC